MVDKNEIVVSYSITWDWDGPVAMQAAIWIQYQIMLKNGGSTMLIVQPYQQCGLYRSEWVAKIADTFSGTSMLKLVGIGMTRLPSFVQPKGLKDIH